MNEELKRLLEQWRMDENICRVGSQTDAAGALRRCADELEAVLESAERIDNCLKDEA